MSHAIRLFGPEKPVAEGRRLRATLQYGNLRLVRSDCVEIDLAVSCVVGDHAWGADLPN